MLGTAVRMLIRTPLALLAISWIHHHYSSMDKPVQIFDHRSICTWMVGGAVAAQILLIDECNAWAFIRAYFAIGFGFLLFGPFELQAKVYAIPTISTPGTIWACSGLVYCCLRSSHEHRRWWTGCRIMSAKEHGG